MPGTKTFITGLIVLTSLFHCKQVDAADEPPLYEKETELVKKLFGSGYDKDIAPQLNSSTPLPVSMRLSLGYILDLNEKKQTLITSLYPTMLWQDKRLAWNPNKTYPFESIAVLPDKLWIPDVQVLSSMISAEEMTITRPRLTLQSTGAVAYTSHIIPQTPCSMDLVAFPFDKTYCHISFGAWTGANSLHFQIDLQEHISLSFYAANTNWNVLSANMSTQLRLDMATKENITTGMLSLHLARKPSFYYRLFVVPAAVCFFVMPIVHFLPPSSHEKLTLGGLMLVSVTVMYEMVEDFFPGSPEGTPLVLHYYTSLLIIIFMSLLLSCLSVMVGTGESKSARVPRFLRICCIDRLGYICCARGRTSRYDYELLHLEKSLKFSAIRQASREEDEQELTEVDENGTESTSASNHTQSAAGKDNGMTEVLKTLINELQYARYKEQIKAEWLQLALVLDRTGGLILLTICVIITVAITLPGH